MKLNLSQTPSPLGQLVIATDEDQVVRALNFADDVHNIRRGLKAQYGVTEFTGRATPEKVASSLGRYFDGDLDAINEIEVATAGNVLEERVWSALRNIQGGKTQSYGELARDLGYTDPRMAIEVGAANGANLIAIVIPCHRVIAKNGDLKGYAWGVHRKRWLLEHEGAIARPAPVRDLPSETSRLPGF